MRSICLLIVLGSALAAPAAAQGAACPPDAQRTADNWYVRDATTHQELTAEQAAQPLPGLHSYEISLTPGYPTVGAIEVTELALTPPAGTEFTREGHAVIVASPSPGPLPITGTWIEHGGIGPDCSRSATLTLNIAALTESPKVHFTKLVHSDRPLVEFTATVTRSQFGIPDPVEVLAKVGQQPVPPTGTHVVLFTLPLGLPPFGATPPSAGLLARRSATSGGVRASAASAFEANNAAQIPVPSGGSAARITFAFDGTGRKLHNRFGSFYRQGALARRGLDVEIVQDGRLLGRMRTGIVCASNHNSGAPRCRLPGYRASS